MRWSLRISIVASVLFAWSSAQAATLPSGTVIAVVQSAEVNGQTGQKTLQLAASVFSGDQVVTGAIGEAQVRFRDNTKLVVGPNSRMVIDAFVFNGDKTARKVTINAVRGAFRFITGSSPKDAYSIITPTATIGVRGTQFDLNVDRSGTAVAVFEGGTRVCDRRRAVCIEQPAGCSVSVTGPGREPRQLSSLDRRSVLQRSFRYINDQGRLLPSFQVNTSSCGVEKADVPASQPSIVLPVVAGSPPPPPPPPPPDKPGNPGNDKPVGNAGESPGGDDFGDGVHGNGDKHNGS